MVYYTIRNESYGRAGALNFVEISASNGALNNGKSASR
jgi:hypothetical protein